MRAGLYVVVSFNFSGFGLSVGPFFWRLFDEVDGSKSNVTTLTITTKEVLCSGCLSFFFSRVYKN
jgi:hypothetical protein